jgi:glucose-1-phosphate thymidylyltransferase
VLDALIDAGITDIAMVGPYQSLSDMQACLDEDDNGADVEYVSQNGHGGLQGAIAAAELFVGDDPCVLHFADGLIGENLGKVLRPHTTETPDLSLLVHRSGNGRDRLGPSAQRALGIRELNPSSAPLGLVGVCRFGPGAWRRACERAAAGPPVFELTDIAERLASRPGALGVGYVRTWRRYCGDPLDLLELNRIVLDQQVPDAELFELADNRIEGRVIIHPSAEVTSSTILGPTIIGRGARVSGSWIGPYTSIGARAEIEGAEIERSIIADGARIMHVGGRIEASTVGRRASIFRDFTLPRAMRLHVGDGVELALN